MLFGSAYYETDDEPLEVTECELEIGRMLLKRKTLYPTKIIFNDPATVVFWSDKTKTVVKAMSGDIYDPEKGVAMCFMKRMLGDDYRKCLNWIHEETKKPIDEGALHYILRALKKLPTEEVTNE